MHDAVPEQGKAVHRDRHHHREREDLVVGAPVGTVAASHPARHHQPHAHRHAGEDRARWCPAPRLRTQNSVSRQGGTRAHAATTSRQAAGADISAEPASITSTVVSSWTITPPCGSQSARRFEARSGAPPCSASPLPRRLARAPSIWTSPVKAGRPVCGVEEVVGRPAIPVEPAAVRDAAGRQQLPAPPQRRESPSRRTGRRSAACAGAARSATEAEIAAGVDGIAVMERQIAGEHVTEEAFEEPAAVELDTRRPVRPCRPGTSTSICRQASLRVRSRRSANRSQRQGDWQRQRVASERLGVPGAPQVTGQCRDRPVPRWRPATATAAWANRAIIGLTLT